VRRLGERADLLTGCRLRSSHCEATPQFSLRDTF
jgi:hypothetical protein